jgi:hypothetical protein
MISTRRHFGRPPRDPLRWPPTPTVKWRVEHLKQAVATWGKVIRNVLLQRRARPAGLDDHDPGLNPAGEREALSARARRRIGIGDAIV